MKQNVEVGTLKELLTKDKRYLFHREGLSIEQAKVVKELKDQGFTQQQIAGELDVSQAKICILLKLITSLHPELIKRAELGEIGPMTAWHLAHLPMIEQTEYVAKERIRKVEVEQRRRQHAINSEVLDLIEKPMLTDCPKETHWHCQICDFTTIYGPKISDHMMDAHTTTHRQP